MSVTAGTPPHTLHRGVVPRVRLRDARRVRDEYRWGGDRAHVTLVDGAWGVRVPADDGPTEDVEVQGVTVRIGPVLARRSR